MNLTLVFSRKYRWPEHYFSVWCLGISQKLLTANQFSVSTIFFTNINISFFNLRFDLFSIIAKKSQSNQEQCTLCCGSPCFRVLLSPHYGPLQCFSTYFRKLKEIGVLGPIFPDYIISCDYAICYKFSFLCPVIQFFLLDPLINGLEEEPRQFQALCVEGRFEAIR